MTVSFKETITNYSNSLDREFNFIQLGCNDAVMGDPIINLVLANGWNSGVFVDADGYYIEKAQKTYTEIRPDGKFNFVNAAVLSLGERAKESVNRCKFFSINPDVLVPQKIINNKSPSDLIWLYGDVLVNLTADPTIVVGEGHDGDPRHSPLDYLQGVGSFDYDLVLNQLKIVTDKQDTAGYIARKVFTEDVTEHRKFIKMNIVSSCTINEIFRVAGFENVDLLQTDLETWDVKILSDLEYFDRKPKYIHFEAGEGVSEDLMSKFERCGYKVSLTTDTRDFLAELV